MEGEFWVIAGAFVAQKGVGAVDLVPAVAEVGFGARFVEAGEDLAAGFEGDVRVLAAPDYEEFGADFGGAGEGVVMVAAAERGLGVVGGV